MEGLHMARCARAQMPEITLFDVKICVFVFAIFRLDLDTPAWQKFVTPKWFV